MGKLQGTGKLGELEVKTCGINLWNREKLCEFRENLWENLGTGKNLGNLGKNLGKTWGTRKNLWEFFWRKGEKT